MWVKPVKIINKNLFHYFFSLFGVISFFFFIFAIDLINIIY